MNANLATFVDRYTMRHVRVYPHPIDRVWEAITDDEQVGAWMGFPVTFDVREGGRCVWGSPDGPYFETKIEQLEPKTLIEHVGANEHPTGGYMRFELTPHPDGCRFDFTQYFQPGQTWESYPDDLGGDLPGGIDTPWRPGFVGGFHSAFDGLGRVLDGLDPLDGYVPADQLFGRLVDHWAARKVNEGELSRQVADRYAKELREAACWNDLNEVYRKHIRDTIPAG